MRGPSGPRATQGLRDPRSGVRESGPRSQHPLHQHVHAKPGSRCLPLTPGGHFDGWRAHPGASGAGQSAHLTASWDPPAQSSLQLPALQGFLSTQPESQKIPEISGVPPPLLGTRSLPKSRSISITSLVGPPYRPVGDGCGSASSAQPRRPGEPLPRAQPSPRLQRRPRHPCISSCQTAGPAGFCKLISCALTRHSEPTLTCTILHR